MIDYDAKLFLRRQWEIFRQATPLELFFALITLVIGTGMIADGPTFAKIGIPISLPQGAGAIPEQKIALFVFEIFILVLGCMTVFSFLKFRRPVFPELSLRNLLWFLTAFLLVFGILRMLPDFKDNPVLAIRNTSFVWYLIVPLMITYLPLRPAFLESLMVVFSALLFFFLIGDLIDKIPDRNFTIQWYGDSGSSLAAFALAVLYRKRTIYFPVLLVLAVGLAANFQDRTSRTTVAGMLATLIVLSVNLLLTNRASLWPYFKRGLLLLLLISGVFLILKPAPGSSGSVSHESAIAASVQKAIDRGAESSAGLEGFRLKMWGDAWGLFKEFPLLGIGFQRQVVFRIYRGGDEYVANHGTQFLKQAPVAGPHNSYLNAMVRLGFVGIGFFLLHFAAGYVLWTHGAFAAFFIFMGQAIYAFFNVGLESPARSFFILVILGLVLKLGAPKKFGKARYLSP